MSGAPLVVEVERSGFVESVHLVDVAVTDDRGGLVAWAGDPERPAAFRSSAKPIQARTALEAGWQPGDERHLAVACASHSGEPQHVEAVRAVLAAAGIPESALACPPDLPLSFDDARAARDRARVYHNCSGKHAGMLAACAAAGWPVEGYRDPEHPLQQRNRARVGDLLGVEPRLLVDGCGVPTFTAPLRALARAFRAIDDGGPEAAAMRAHPFLVGGTDRLDSDLMAAAPGILSKGGAEGLSCITAGGIGIAMKTRDGQALRARGPAVALVLRALDLVDDGLVEKLRAHTEPSVLGGGEPVGTVRAHGTLARS